MNITRHPIFPDIVLIELNVYHDSRGYFFELFQEERYKELGISENFVQDNYSRSCKNTVRGMHYQLKSPQGKLVGVTRGHVYDVIMDIRQHSATFGQWIGIHLTNEKLSQVYIPPGFAHGFCVLSDEADFYYKCTKYYNPKDEFGIAWNDRDVNIQWPIEGTALLSEKDQKYPFLKEIGGESLP